MRGLAKIHILREMWTKRLAHQPGRVLANNMNTQACLPGMPEGNPYNMDHSH